MLERCSTKPSRRQMEMGEDQNACVLQSSRVITLATLVAALAISSCSEPAVVYKTYDQFRSEWETADCSSRKSLLLGLLNAGKFGNRDTIIRFKGKDTNLLEGVDTLTMAVEYAMKSLELDSTPCYKHVLFVDGNFPTFYRGNRVYKIGYYFVVDYDGLATCLADSLSCP